MLNSAWPQLTAPPLKDIFDFMEAFRTVKFKTTFQKLVNTSQATLWVNICFEHEQEYGRLIL